MSEKPLAKNRLPPMLESEWMHQVIDLVELLGYEWAHFRPAQTSKGWRTPVSGPLGKGFPDLVLLRDRDQRFLVIELKSEAGRLTDEQLHVLASFRASNVQALVARPGDLENLAAALS